MSAPTHPARASVRVVLLWTGRLLLVLGFAAGLLILAGRTLIMPELAAQRAAVEQRLGAAIGLPVRIAALTAEWPGLHPRLTLAGFELRDRDGRPALEFERVEAEIGWSSLWHFGLRLHRLEIVAPSLDIRRDAAGVFHVAGLAVHGAADSSLPDWLLQQRRIVVRDARVSWHDELRGAPPLELRGLNFELNNGLLHHRFGLTTEPPAGLAGRIDIRGDLVGSDATRLDDWRGDLYADLERTDLAAWAPWIDLPLEWRRGEGAVRLWLSLAAARPTAFTADLRLKGVAVRLRPDLPQLELAYLEGRLSGRRTGERYVGEIKRLQLATADGIELAPTDARLEVNVAGRDAGGEFHANTLDFGALAALAGHLPLPEEIHERLRSFDPRGRLSGVALSWRGPASAPLGWRVKSGFADLALAPFRELPGFAGLSGSLAGDERAGEVKLDSRQVRLELPAVFPEPTLELASLKADAGWRSQGGQLELLLPRAQFENADAKGEASGSYRYTGTGLGEIDLSAKLGGAAGNAVWRYMPLVVNKDARDWLRAAIVGGRADSASLRLKGPLDRFPFRDNQGGIFQVRGSFQGATLDYAEGWPKMTDIDGDLLFEGVRMRIRGQRAALMGATLSDVEAEIADLESMEEILSVHGRARGATQQFLDFIEASPVGARIDHFTQAMTAHGRGELELRLVLPLRNLAQSQVAGRYRFAANQIRPLPDLPPFTAAQGELSFSADRLQAKGLRAQLAGMPVTVDIASLPGGGVKVSAAGSLQAQALRKEYGWRILDHLSGEAPWRGTVSVKKPGAEILVESTLDGISSSLPLPFNKSQRAPLPFRLEGRIDPQRDQWTATLGGVAQLRLQQADKQWRGRLAIGDEAAKPGAALPARGVALAVAQARLDGDAWRELLAANGAAAASPFELAAIDLKTDELRLLGRNFHDLRLAGMRGDARWRFNLDSREAEGQLSWDGAGKGRLSGRLKQLSLPAGNGAAAAAGVDPADATRELPALDLVIDNFRLRDMAFGELRLNAENRDGRWQAQVDMKNEAARLSGKGTWRPSATAPESALQFKLDVSDAEKLLARLGLPDAVRRGATQLDGNVAWAGSPFAFDWPSLSGRLKIDAERGQFKKLEPGVGRLLGVLSLQSLPRRISLDFRDVFSEGFAFDSIEGEANIRNGVMSSEELRIRGPAAKVLISGQASLVAETQDLKVRVQPAVGESLAVGAMLAHPAAGAVAWAAQKILNDPLDQAFAYEFSVTGPWADPKVEKLNRPAEAPRSP